MANKIGRYLKIGDIFEVPLENETKGYVQFIGRDLIQLNTDVLRAFRGRYGVEAQPSLEEIVSDKVDFYAHVTSIKFGEEDGIWKKIGKSDNVGDISKSMFRSTHDWAVNGNVDTSERWYVWQVGGERKNVISNFDQLSKADIGLVLLPKDVAVRMETGKYSFHYPSFPGEKEKTSL